MNVFLVPAPPQNIAQTISHAVDFRLAAELIGERKASDLAAALGGRNAFNCWAATEGKNRTLFDAMSPDDELLFAVTHSGQFQWRGRVRAKLVSAALGDKLWPHKGDTGNQPNRGKRSWELIYIVDGLKQIRLRKSAVLCLFGYDNPQTQLNGLRKVPDWRLKIITSRFGNLDEALGSLT